jgi:small glutamine-rich tetratricopeptide repeat-containing protein alpha
MGLAYSSVEKHKEAVDCFKKAIEIEPENESYHSNLKLAEDRLAAVGSPGQGNLQLFNQPYVVPP